MPSLVPSRTTRDPDPLGAMNVPKEIFREYDIRGLVDTQLTPALASAIGRAFATTAARRLGRPAVLVVGRDNRPSGERLAAGVRAGIVAAGGTAVDVGMLPTPALSFATTRPNGDGGVQVTGSAQSPRVHRLQGPLRQRSLHRDDVPGLL